MEIPLWILAIMVGVPAIVAILALAGKGTDFHYEWTTKIQMLQGFQKFSIKAVNKD